MSSSGGVSLLCWSQWVVWCPVCAEDSKSGLAGCGLGCPFSGPEEGVIDDPNPLAPPASPACLWAPGELTGFSLGGGGVLLSGGSSSRRTRQAASQSGNRTCLPGVREHWLLLKENLTRSRNRISAPISGVPQRSACWGRNYGGRLQAEPLREKAIRFPVERRPLPLKPS